jgi:hypothetical protein
MSSVVQGLVSLTITLVVLSLLHSILVVDVLEFAGGVYFFFMPFEQHRTRATWARALCFIVAALLVFVGAADFLRHRALWMPSLKVQHAMLEIIPSVRGVALGLLLALLFSGQIRGQRREM